MDNPNISEVIEVAIRGQVGKVFSEIEVALSIIILFTNTDEVSETLIDKAAKFKGMMLGKKIEKAIEMLEKYHPKIYADNKDIFDELNVLKDFRNQIMHCGFSWNESDLSQFTIWDIETEPGKDGFQYFKEIVCTVEDANDNIYKSSEVCKKIFDLLPKIGEKFVKILSEVIRANSLK